MPLDVGQAGRFARNRYRNFRPRIDPYPFCISYHPLFAGTYRDQYPCPAGRSFCWVKIKFNEEVESPYRFPCSIVVTVTSLSSFANFATSWDCFGTIYFDFGTIIRICWLMESVPSNSSFTNPSITPNCTASITLPTWTVSMIITLTFRRVLFADQKFLALFYTTLSIISSSKNPSLTRLGLLPVSTAAISGLNSIYRIKQSRNCIIATVETM